MAVASLNPAMLNSNAYVEMYIAPYVAPAGANLAAQEASLLGLFYSATPVAGVRVLLPAYAGKPWGITDENGVEVDFKETTVENKTQLGVFDAGCAYVDISMSGTFCDIDSAHLADLFGVASADITTVTPGAGIAGRTVTAVGHQTRPVFYTIMLRTPNLNGLNVAGSVDWDCWIFPKVRFTHEYKFKMTGKDAYTAPVKMSANPDLNMLGSNGRPIPAIFSQVTTVATS